MSADVAQLSVVIKGDTEDAERKIGGVNRQVKESGGFFKDALKNALSFASGQAIYNGIGTAIGFISSNLTDMVKQGMDGNRIMDVLAQGLKSTHDASGQTVESLDALSNSIMNMTGIDDDSTKAAEQMLLTFTGIGKDAFPLATQAAADMATRMNGGAIPSAQQMQQQALLLGKALNDPAQGLTALTREGVTFSDQQKEQIKHMVAVGDTAGAQKIMLQELSKEFGGSAKAAGEANGGMAILSAQFDNMKQTVGQALVPVLLQLMEAARPIVQWAADHLPGALKTLTGFINTNVMPIIKQLGQWFLTEGLPALKRFGDFVMTTVVPALQQLGQWIGTNVIPFLKQLFTWFNEHVMPVLKQVADVIIKDVVPALKNIGEQVMTKLVPSLQKLWEKISPVLIPVLQLLGWIISHVVGPVLGFLIDLIAKIIGWIADFIGKIGDLLGWLGRLKDNVGRWVGDMLTKAGELKDKFLSKLGELKDNAVSKFNELKNNVMNALADWPNKLRDMGVNLIQKIIDGVKSMGGNLSGALGDLIRNALHNIVLPGGGHLPGFASGGILPDGLAIVGEHGPELMVDPGARVYSASETRNLLRPAVSASGSGGGGSGGGGTQHIIIMLDGRQIAENTIEHMPNIVRLGTGLKNW